MPTESVGTVTKVVKMSHGNLMEVIRADLLDTLQNARLIVNVCCASQQTCEPAAQVNITARLQC